MPSNYPEDKRRWPDDADQPDPTLAESAQRELSTCCTAGCNKWIVLEYITYLQDLLHDHDIKFEDFPNDPT